MNRKNIAVNWSTFESIVPTYFQDGLEVAEGVSKLTEIKLYMKHSYFVLMFTLNSNDHDWMAFELIPRSNAVSYSY